MLKAILLITIELMIGSNMPAVNAYGQSKHISYLGNAISHHWKVLASPHIRIIFPNADRSAARKLAPKAERIYEEYKKRLGTAPEEIALYYLGNRKVISRARASKTFEPDIIWASPLAKRGFTPFTNPSNILRYEIATAFQHYIESEFIKYWNFIHYFSDDVPWKDGLIPFLVHPNPTNRQQNALRTYWPSKKHHSISRQLANKMNAWIGYSQIQYFVNTNNGRALPNIYTQRKSFLGFFNYFDFKPAFKQASGISYSTFQKQWRKAEHSALTADTLRPVRTNQASNSTSSTSRHSINRVDEHHSRDSTIIPYHALLHTQTNIPIVLPYYASPDNYGLGMFLRFGEPMGIQSFSLSGLFSFAHPVHKSYINFKYVNNSFRPRLTFRFNHFSSGALIIGRLRETRSTSVLAASSLWKLSGISHDKSNWYFGLRMRYMAFQYLPQKTMRDKFPHLFFRNRKTHQTDLKAVLTWSHIKLDKNTFINPGSGFGLQLSATGSDKILGSDVRYLRLNLGAYTILPAFRKRHLYLFADGMIDLGAPAGRDYLALSSGGNYELTNPRFLGEVNPGLKRFVRGYNTRLTGSRFLFGRVEYRIPFEFNTTKKLFGFIPPARTVFTFFSDAGVMGNAKITQNQVETQYRWSAGFEIKRAFSFAGSIQFAYELGIAQALTRPFGPHPYFRVQMAIPF